MELGSITWQFTPHEDAERSTGLLTLGWHLSLLEQPGTWCGEITWQVVSGGLLGVEWAALPTAVQWVLEALIEDWKDPAGEAEHEEDEDATG